MVVVVGVVVVVIGTQAPWTHAPEKFCAAHGVPSVREGPL